MYKYILVTVVFLLSVLAYGEYHKKYHYEGLYVAPEKIIIKTNNQQVWIWGENESTWARTVLSSITSYRSDVVRDIEDIPVETGQSSGNVKLLKVSQNILLISWRNQKVWVLQNPSEEELNTLKTAPIGLDGDLVLFQKKAGMDIFEPGADRLIYWGSGRIAKDIQKKAEEKKKPLLSVKKLEAIRIVWNEQTRTWDLKTQS